jgi:hypothetical protein
MQLFYGFPNLSTSSFHRMFLGIGLSAFTKKDKYSCMEIAE